jgi:hypothetical protein
MNDNDPTHDVSTPAPPPPAHPAPRTVRKINGLVAALILIALFAYAFKRIHHAYQPESSPPGADRQRPEDETKDGSNKTAAGGNPAAEPPVIPTVRLTIDRSATGGFPYSGFSVEEIDGQGRKFDQTQAGAGFQGQPGSRWKVTLRGDLYGAHEQALASVLLTVPGSGASQSIHILLPPALAEIQVVNHHDNADYSLVRIAGPAAPQGNAGSVTATGSNNKIAVSDLLPNPALVNPPPQPFPGKNHPLHVPVAGRGPWRLTYAGSRLGDRQPPPVTVTGSAVTLLETPPPLSGTYSLVAPMTRFPDGPDNPGLETIKTAPVKVGNNHEVDYFNEMVYLSDDTDPRKFRNDFKKKYLPTAELPHYLGLFMELDLKNSRNSSDGTMAVLLTYPHVGFVEYQGDLSAQFDADGTLRLVLLGHEGFAGGAAHEGVNAWSTEYTRLIQAREPAALRRFMERSLAEWVSYQCQTHDLPGEIGKSSLNFSKWDYVRDTNVLVFDVESRNDELWIRKAVQVYPKKLLYCGHDKPSSIPEAVCAVMLKKPFPAKRVRASVPP